MYDGSTKPLRENLKALIHQKLKIKHITVEEISDNDMLFGEKLGLDSIDAIEVVYLVEKHFGVSIKDMKEARPALQSINTLAAFIEARGI